MTGPTPNDPAITFSRWRPHPWHGLSAGAEPPARVYAFIEITPFDTVKYEIDKASGYLRVDRPQRTSSLPPTLYGFIPRTFCDDGDPLDVLVLGQEPVYPLTIVEARAVGAMRMRDEKGIDDKIVAVSVGDPAFSDFTDKMQLPAHVLRELRRFFEDYKALEHKQVIVEDLLGPDQAIKIIREALELYRRLRRGELVKV